MAKNTPLGLAELIEHVKQDLLNTETDGSARPLFSIDEINLELSVSIEKSANAGISISVLQFGGSKSHADAQRISITMSPLISKEERIARLKQNNPDEWAEIEDTSKKLNRGLS